MAPKNLRRSSTLVLGVPVVLSSALLTGCTPDGTTIDADYAQVCQDKTTNQRADDSKCSDSGRSSGHYGWYFYGMGSSGSTTKQTVPPVGSALSGGQTSIPQGATSKSGVPTKGSTTVARGGFGGSVKGNGG